MASVKRVTRGPTKRYKINYEKILGVKRKRPRPRRYKFNFSILKNGVSDMKKLSVEMIVQKIRSKSPEASEVYLRGKLDRDEIEGYRIMEDN